MKHNCHNFVVFRSLLTMQMHPFNHYHLLQTDTHNFKPLQEKKNWLQGIICHRLLSFFGLSFFADRVQSIRDRLFFSSASVSNRRRCRCLGSSSYHNFSLAHAFRTGDSFPSVDAISRRVCLDARSHESEAAWVKARPKRTRLPSVWLAWR